ncbi:RNase H-like domain found in reverse transcriptase [Popillia japonica]|uniref:RNase H-like domain found in reverse transcriptase n=1 Tax=Popillia japonica TaxID=7064 RepID=A0AAW1HSZ2_POPJA
MSYDCLLGRDFISSSLINVKFDGNNVTIENNCVIDNELFLIDVDIDDTKDLISNLNISKDISFEQRHEFIHMFNSAYIQPARTNSIGLDFVATIKVEPNHDKFFYRPRRLSYADKQTVHEITNDLVNRGIIRKCSSPYASPIVLVNKKNGTKRMCVDYRDLNKIVVKDRFPIPNIVDQIDGLHGKKWFSKLDLKDAFHNIKLDMAKSGSFLLILDKYRVFLVLPAILDSVAAVNSYPVPANTRQVQSFLGLASYFRKFIKNFSIIAKPLYDLLKKNRVFKFGELEFKKMHPVMYFSKRTTDCEMRYHSYELECLAIVNVIKRCYSRPKRIISDRGTAFTSKLFEEAMDDLHVQHIRVAAGTPRANGQVERINRIIVPMLAKISPAPDRWDENLDLVEFNLNNTVNKSTGNTPSRYRIIVPMLAKISPAPDRWDENLDLVEFNLNNTVNKSTGNTPSRLLFGADQEGKVIDSLREILENIEEGRRDLSREREIAAEKIEKTQGYNTKYYNRGRSDSRKYNIGDYVVITNTVSTPGVDKKLMPKFRGPYVISKCLGNDR